MYQGLKCRTIRVIQLIVDLYLKGGLAVVVGAGAEGLKKINSLLTQECEILLVSRESNPKVEKYLKDGAIKFLQADLQDAKFLLEYNPILVMATTDDHALNRMIVNEARKIPGCMAYASDDPESSDFSHPSVINIKDTVQITISTKSTQERLECKNTCCTSVCTMTHSSNPERFLNSASALPVSLNVNFSSTCMGDLWNVTRAFTII